MRSKDKNASAPRITSIDLLRGLVMVLMALDHVRMYFGVGTWYASPTDLATTTPGLFFTRWITHFCAPVFVFLAGTSAFLRGAKGASKSQTAWFLLTRGIWLVVVEVAIVNFGWTFDVTYSLLILQVIWAIGISMIVLAALVFLPTQAIVVVGLIIIFGHNLLDPLRRHGLGFLDYAWYVLHQPQLVVANGRLISIFYPVLPWAGLMVLGYAFGSLFGNDVPAARRTVLLLASGIAALALFLILRLFNLYGEPIPRQTLDSDTFTLLSFLNTTKYPPSLQFLLMTMGPALVFLALIEYARPQATNPLVVFGRVPFFFYIVHIYLIHALAMMTLALTGWDWREYILSAPRFRSGRLEGFGFGLEAVYSIWAIVVILLYPLCRWYQQVRQNHPGKWWLSYL